jgi:serine/threonine-protein kinase
LENASLPKEISETLRLKLTRKIAEGGMGNIYEAVVLGPEEFEKTVCVKMIKEKYSRDEEFVGRFVGEAKLVADLVHQNIVQIYKLGRVGRVFYILMEYVQGVNLSQFIKRHNEMDLKVPGDLGVFIASRICRGLEYAHNKKDRMGSPLGVVHRDISPKNLMLSSEGEVKILDFGVAKAAMFAPDEGEVVVGKFSYMSPEQAQRLTTDKRSDVFSLGVVMYELLTGEKLFGVPHAETQVIVRNILEKPIPDLSRLNNEVTEPLEKIVRRALERDPWKRYQDAGDMGYDLEYFLYNRGYGPTIVTLESYLKQMFPELYQARPAQAAER